MQKGFRKFAKQTSQLSHHVRCSAWGTSTVSIAALKLEFKRPVSALVDMCAHVTRITEFCSPILKMRLNT
jgi:hypothetical protein